MKLYELTVEDWEAGTGKRKMFVECAASLYTGGPSSAPIVAFEGNHDSRAMRLPLAEARKLARKILAIPTPIGFEELPDV